MNAIAETTKIPNPSTRLRVNRTRGISSGAEEARAAAASVAVVAWCSLRASLATGVLPHGRPCLEALEGT
jgi:hypothetical protein